MYARDRDEWGGDLYLLTHGKKQNVHNSCSLFWFCYQILHLRNNVEKPDYKNKGIGRNIPAISCCILPFKILYAHASALTHLL